MSESGSAKDVVICKFLDTKSMVMIDNTLLIKEVKKKPVIYDKSLKNTNENAAMRRQAWIEVAAKVYSDHWDYWNSRQKDKALAYAQKRWTNMKNCFHREVRVQKNSRSQSSCRRKYIYYDMLLFLANRNQSSETNDQDDNKRDADDDGESNKSNSDGGEDVTLIDNEEFIREVEKLPLLYDKSLPGGSNAGCRKKCWSEICAKLFPDWEFWDSDRQEEAVKEAQKRWHNLRNCFIREIRYQRRNPTVKRRKYIYYDTMQFLLGHCGQSGLSLDTQNQNEFECKQEYQDYDEEADYFEIDMDVDEPTSSSQNSRKRTSVEELIIEDPLQLKKGREEGTGVDQDMNFALSIVPMLKSLPLGAKLQVQIEILKLFQKVTK